METKADQDVILDMEMEENNKGTDKTLEEKRQDFEGQTSEDLPNMKQISWLEDSFDEEVNRVSVIQTASKVVSKAVFLQLAFQSLGVVYGDIGTSPLYVFASTFTDRVPSHGDILGALSLIIYTLTLFPLIKYVFIVLWANDNGDGGTFALYSLICRYSKVSAIPSRKAEKTQFSAYKMKLLTKNLKRAEMIKEAMERSTWAKVLLLSVALLGTCMVIGDGILTPCLSVLSAVDGVRKLDSRLHRDIVVAISVAILVVLFLIQRFGTEKISFTFAPVILVWYTLIGSTGVFNLIHHDFTVIEAFNPVFAVRYFQAGPKKAWISLGGVVLCMTGTEAMFADLGHFSVRSIQIAFTGLVFPCLLCAYVGQAAYLSNHPNDVSDAFYKSIPELVYWPTFVIAVLASIIASQAMISATFSIVKQSMALGCFPRVRIIHTSHKHEGQVYIPEINFLLMFACVSVILSFKETISIGNAYGIAVVAVMIVTSSFVVLIMLMVWQTSLLLIVLFVIVFGSFELLYFSSVMYKFSEGGYLPISFSVFLFFVMYVWHYVQVKRHEFEVKHKVSGKYFSSLGSDLGISRVPGVSLLYTELTQGIPAIFQHFLTNLPALHSILVFVSVKYLPVNKVPTEERFLLRRVGTKDYNMYRCVVRYGYRDWKMASDEFQQLLMSNLKSVIRMEDWEGEEVAGAEEQMKFLERSCSSGLVYLLGHSEVKAREDAGLVKRVVVDYVYDFLRRNSRQGFVDLDIPNKNLLQVGMNYSI